MVDVSEKSFEQAIEQTLLAGGPDEYGDKGNVVREPKAQYGDFIPGGYRKRQPEDYHRSLCLDPGAVLDFIYVTQPKEWEKLKQCHGTDVKDRFLKRLSSEVSKRGTLDVLRKGVKDSGCNGSSRKLATISYRNVAT